MRLFDTLLTTLLLATAAAAGAGGVKLWGSVDARVGGGYGLEGATAFIGVNIAIK